MDGITGHVRVGRGSFTLSCDDRAIGRPSLPFHKGKPPGDIIL